MWYTLLGATSTNVSPTNPNHYVLWYLVAVVQRDATAVKGVFPRKLDYPAVVYLSAGPESVNALGDET